MFEHPVEGKISNGITASFKNEVGKAVIAQAGAAMIPIKCVEAHKAKQKLRMAQEQMQGMT